MSKQEMLVLSTKDRDRLKVLHEVKRKHLTPRAAARQLGISERWVRKLLVRVRKGGDGDGGIVHRGRGRRSNRRLPESLRTQTQASVEPALAGKPAHPNAEAGAGEVQRLW